MRRTSFSVLNLFTLPSTHTRPGKDSGRPARPRQDSLPSFESSICKIHGLMVWLLPSHAGYSIQRRHARSLPRSLCHLAPYLPLRRYQVPCLRADPRRHNSIPRERDAHPSTTQRQLSWHHLCLLHLPSRSHSRATSLRDQNTAQD